MSVHLVAFQLHRTESAITSRLRELGAATGLTADELYDAIQDDQHFDLLSLAREEHAKRRMPLWTSAMDDVLYQAWEAGTPTLDLLAEQFGVRPTHVVDRLVLRRLARSTVDAVERLGVDAGSDLGVRMRLAADKTAAMVWALVLTNAAGETVHLSLHAQQGIAHAELDELRPAPGATPDPDVPRFWAILPRVVGEIPPSTGERGAFFDTPATPEPELPPAAPKRTRRPRRPRSARVLKEPSTSSSATPRVLPDDYY
jgi:hypothetical protein